MPDLELLELELMDEQAITTYDLHTALVIVSFSAGNVIVIRGPLIIQWLTDKGLRNGLRNSTHDLLSQVHVLINWSKK